MVDHLIISDAHAHPDNTLDRFKWLGNYILEHKPAVIICLGDFADMPSLCSYDKGTRGFEGRRYHRDRHAVLRAMTALLKPMREDNEWRKIGKKKQYKPKMVMCLGNHENRINRAIENDAMLEGTLSIKDLGYEKAGWEVHPFLDVVNVDGINYSHYFISGVMGRPISGVHPAASIISKQLVSCTAGHAHVYDHTVRTNAQNEKIHGLVAGVFDDNEHDYAGRANDLWWRGIIHKRNVKNGSYDLEMISMETLEAQYG